jgi:hypothetical protein
VTRFAVTPDVHSFLEEFTASSNGLDSAAPQGHHWAETFLSVDPVRAATVTRAAMLEVLPRRREMFERIGARQSELVEAAETRLDERHTLVRTAWRWRLAAASDTPEELVLRSTFLLRREETGWRIVVYLNHQDVPALLAARR